MQAVVLNRCNLSHVKSNTLTPLIGSLKEFYLTHNMQPLDLPDGLFTGLRLETLSLVSKTLLESNLTTDVQENDAKTYRKTNLWQEVSH